MTRSLPTTAKLAAVLATVVSLLSGCRSGGTEQVTPSANPSSASPSLSASLSAEEQALADSLESVRLYSQTYVDLFVDPAMPIDALHEVIVDPALAKDMQSAAKFRGEGWTNKPGATVTIEDGVLKAADLSGKSQSLVLWACVDSTRVTSVQPDGTEDVGDRQLLEFTLKQTTLNTPGGWAVSSYSPTDGQKQPKPC